MRKTKHVAKRVKPALVNMTLKIYMIKNIIKCIEGVFS